MFWTKWDTAARGQISTCINHIHHYLQTLSAEGRRGLFILLHNSPCLVSLSIVDIFKNNVFLSFNLFAKIQRCIRKLRMITKSSERVCSLGAQTNGYESSRWLSPIFPFCFLQSSPPRLIFTNPPPLVLLAIARLGHTQGSIGCQTPHCIPLQPCTPRWPHSKRMAHRGEPQRAANTQFIISQYHSQGSILLTIVHLNRQLDFQMSKETVYNTYKCYMMGTQAFLSRQVLYFQC